jgi:hypothetical protein
MDISISQLSNQLPHNIAVWIDQLLECQPLDKNKEGSDNQLMITFSSLPLELRKRGYKNMASQYYCHFSLLDICRIYFAYHLIAKSTLPMLMVLIKLADDEEKTSIAKGLSLFDITGDLLENVIDLTRTNCIELFAALALNNPYPAKNFPEHNFNQLVLKALFNDLNIEAVDQLPLRRNEELSRMVVDYRDERLAANRAVPVSLLWAVSS